MTARCPDTDSAHQLNLDQDSCFAALERIDQVTAGNVRALRPLAKLLGAVAARHPGACPIGAPLRTAVVLISIQEAREAGRSRASRWLTHNLLIGTLRLLRTRPGATPVAALVHAAIDAISAARQRLLAGQAA